MGTTDSHCGHTIHRVGTKAPNERTAVGASPLMAGALQYNLMHITRFLLTPGGQRSMTVSILCLATEYTASGKGQTHQPVFHQGKVKLTIRPVSHQGKGQTHHPACIPERQAAGQVAGHGHWWTPACCGAFCNIDNTHTCVSTATSLGISSSHLCIS